MAYTYTTSPTYTLANTGSSTTWATITNGSSNLTPNTLQVKGTAEFENDANFQGDLKLQGKSLKESLDKIEARLAILHPNEELEEKWENLRGLRKLYMELEAEIIEKEKMWSILKK
jgi:hypothetical protein